MVPPGWLAGIAVRPKEPARNSELTSPGLVVALPPPCGKAIAKSVLKT